MACTANTAGVIVLTVSLSPMNCVRVHAHTTVYRVSGTRAWRHTLEGAAMWPRYRAWSSYYWSNASDGVTREVLASGLHIISD